MTSDTINKPAHYTQSTIQPIDVIEDWDLNFHLGNTIKYICRHRNKGKPIEDLEKAAWYLNREIERLKNAF